MKIQKTQKNSTHFLPLEWVSVNTEKTAARRLRVRDSRDQAYVDQPIASGQTVRFRVRGVAGQQKITIEGDNGQALETQWMLLTPRTAIQCDKGPYAALMTKVQQMIEANTESQPWVINERKYELLICWSRDHVYTLKAARYFMTDVLSGLDYFLDSQLPNGMFWDHVADNIHYPAPSILGEALGQKWSTYDDGMKYVVRRVPILADTEYVFTEGVWLAWKASGDDAWMTKQLPRLEKGLRYVTTDPLRWSKKYGLIRRSFTMDEWDFANTHYCAKDCRCIYPQDPHFLFHGNQSGLYAMHWRLAEMHEHVGNMKRAKELRQTGEKLRKRANAKLFFDTHYGHMIPETLDEKKVYALVGDERERMSLSTGYTINRKLPTHEMAVKILKEYQRRGKVHKSESFAEWWSMDPMYTESQWPDKRHSPEGEYMNGGITPMVAGELAKAAYDHGLEAYGTDILERLWKLSQRDHGWLHQVYRRLPENPSLPETSFQHVDLRAIVNRGLRDKAHRNVEAWLGEGNNDMRNLPTGKRRFGVVEFDVIKPTSNGGRVVLRLDTDSSKAAGSVTIPIKNLKGKSLYFLHCLGRGSSGIAAATYDVRYADGTTERIWVRPGQEIGLWWGTREKAVNQKIARRAWWGANGQWKDVGIYTFGWNNPHPDKEIIAIHIEMMSTSNTSILLAGISVGNQPVKFDVDIRSYGLPACWAQGAVYYAIAEGLAGVEDTGAAFSSVKVSPRWAGTQAQEASVTLHYPASDGYCSYQYKLDRKARQITLELTGSFQQAKVHCLLPGTKAKRVLADGKAVAFQNTIIEKSRYADFLLDGLPRSGITIHY